MNNLKAPDPVLTPTAHILINIFNLTLNYLHSLRVCVKNIYANRSTIYIYKNKLNSFDIL